MVVKWGTVHEQRNFLTACVLGLAISLLAGSTLAWGQGANPVSPAPPLVASQPATEATTAHPPPIVAINDYTVSPEDLLEIVIMDVPEVSRTYCPS